MTKIQALILLLISFNMHLHSQQINQTIVDPVRQREVLIDLLDRNALTTGEMGTYYAQDYEIYKPDAQVIEQLKPAIANIYITIILASWCGDSKEQLPRFMKVLDQAVFNMDRLTMIGVDSHKKAREIDVVSYHAERVPTFIIYRDEKEAGRIIESPVESLELDLLNILSK